jgi:hypothetical protein
MRASQGASSPAHNRCAGYPSIGADSTQVGEEQFHPPHLSIWRRAHLGPVKAVPSPFAYAEDLLGVVADCAVTR